MVESDADSSAKSVHSSQEDDNDVAVAERPPTTLRRQPARKRPTVASAVFSDDSDDDEEEDADEGQGHGIGARERGGAIQRSVSSDLSNDESRSPSPAPHPRQSRQSAGGRVKRARRAPFPEGQSSQPGRCIFADWDDSSLLQDWTSCLTVSQILLFVFSIPAPIW